MSRKQAKRMRFYRRQRIARQWLRAVAKQLAIALNCPDRPWFKLSIPGV